MKGTLHGRCVWWIKTGNQTSIKFEVQSEVMCAVQTAIRHAKQVQYASHIFTIEQSG